MNDEQMTAAIAADLGIGHLPLESQQKLIGQFGEIALKAATLAVVGKLSEEKKEAFAKLAEAGEPAALKAFLDTEVPGHEELAKQAVAEEVKQFRAFQAA